MKISRLTIRFLIFWGMVIGGTLTLISGLILWLAPHGSHSREILLYGLQKSVWLELHPYLAFMAVGLLTLHLIDKWRCLKVYVRSPIKDRQTQREASSCPTSSSTTF